MARRDVFRRRTVAELEALPTIGSAQPLGLVAPLNSLVEELKIEGLPFRYSLIRDTRRPPMLPTRVAYRRHDGQEWEIVPVSSIGFLIQPMEQAARAANARGDRLTALLLTHALLELMMRADPVAKYRHEDTFGRVLEEFRRRLRERDLPGVDVAALSGRIRAVNDRRNDVLKVQLLRDGYEATLASLTPADFETWMQAYDETLNAVIEFVSL